MGVAMTTISQPLSKLKSTPDVLATPFLRALEQVSGFLETPITSYPFAVKSSPKEPPIKPKPMIPTLIYSLGIAAKIESPSTVTIISPLSLIQYPRKKGANSGVIAEAGGECKLSVWHISIS